HDQSVLGGQAGLVGQQVPAQRHRLVGPDRAVAGGGVEPARVRVAQPLGAGIDVRVVGGDGAVVAEVQAADAHRLEVAVIGAGVDPGGLAERVGELAEVRAGGLEVLVRAEGGDDPAGEGGVRGERVVRGEVVDGIVGGGQDGDLELVEQGAGSVLGPGELLGDLVVHRVGGARVQHGL